MPRGDARFSLRFRRGWLDGVVGGGSGTTMNYREVDERDADSWLNARYGGSKVENRER